MFCPYCGTETTQGLNYCNRCGGNLAPLMQAGAQEQQQEQRTAVVEPGSVWAAGLSTAAVIVIGLGLIFPITTELAARGVKVEALVLIAFFIALTVFGCARLLLRFWSMLFGVARPTRREARALRAAKSHDTRVLDPARYDSLNPASVNSITEQTTRTLDRVKKR